MQLTIWPFPELVWIRFSLLNICARNWSLSNSELLPKVLGKQKIPRNAIVYSLVLMIELWSSRRLPRCIYTFWTIQISSNSFLGEAWPIWSISHSSKPIDPKILFNGETQRHLPRGKKHSTLSSGHCRKIKLLKSTLFYRVDQVFEHFFVVFWFLVYFSSFFGLFYVHTWFIFSLFFVVFRSILGPFLVHF